ncbi:hypothetical protein FRB90_002211 [Tulasnella sp. 427]|nr:hypothetical protein FRB90_002211 [Tulasnella sp. 427]
MAEKDHRNNPKKWLVNKSNEKQSVKWAPLRLEDDADDGAQEDSGDGIGNKDRQRAEEQVDEDAVVDLLMPRTPILSPGPEVKSDDVGSMSRGKGTASAPIYVSDSDENMDQLEHRSSPGGLRPVALTARSSDVHLCLCERAVDSCASLTEIFAETERQDL